MHCGPVACKGRFSHGWLEVPEHLNMMHSYPNKLYSKPKYSRVEKGHEDI